MNYNYIVLLLFQSKLPGLPISINREPESLIYFGCICAHVSPQSSSVQLGFVEDFIVEFWSHLYQLKQDTVCYVEMSDCPVLLSYSGVFEPWRAISWTNW